MHWINEKSRLHELLQSRKARHIIGKLFPEFLDNPVLSMFRDIRLEEIPWNEKRLGMDRELLDRVLDAMQRPVEETVPEARHRRSLDEVDRSALAPDAAVPDNTARELVLIEEPAVHAKGPARRPLDGSWDLVEGGGETERLSGQWDAAIPAQVPGSVHAALTKAGRLPDQTVGRNQEKAREASYKTWWLRHRFSLEDAALYDRLCFEGVCNRCDIWLNGQPLGSHEGMFGGPVFPVKDRLLARNELIVRLHAIPLEEKEGGNPDANVSWRRTVVCNNVYGWHYANIPFLGIWRTVELRQQPAVHIGYSFVETVDARRGVIDLRVEAEGPAEGWTGTLTGSFGPENFAGKCFSFRTHLAADGANLKQRLRMTLPEVRAWWPVDLGDPNLYRLRLSFESDSGDAQPDHHTALFGVRTVEMAPQPEGPMPDAYNWTFVINGQPHFMKGTNWCTIDTLLDLRRERYERFLGLARQQHIQLLRAWGGGMPETDDFYDLCDRLGILVFQEWPTAWNSHLDQPYDMLEETVRVNTLRLRGHASLAFYAGGNESGYSPQGDALAMMIRHSIELDGSRAFHTNDPRGGSVHGCWTYWQDRPLDENLTMTAPVLGEFGHPGFPHYESVCRYLPEEERDLWPAPQTGSLVYHTPTFGRSDDPGRLWRYARSFVDDDADLKAVTYASQLAQAASLRHALERARARWPDSVASCYYKLTDNFPAASWATIDWYGVPKASYYLVGNAYAPLHACLLLDRFDVLGQDVSWPVHLMDDADALRGQTWEVKLRVFDSGFALIREQEFPGEGSLPCATRRLGEIKLAYTEVEHSPLFAVVDVTVNGERRDRTAYWFNFEHRRGCLFNRPRTRLGLECHEGNAVLTNHGDRPAIGAGIERPGRLDTFTVSNGCLWMDPGEEVCLQVNSTEGLVPVAWNLESAPLQ